jgi:hypothetical protein
VKRSRRIIGNTYNRAHESDEAAMVRFRREYPEFVQAETEYYAARDAKKKKQASATSSHYTEK